MSNTYRGTDVPMLQRASETYSPQSGYVREFEWRGLSETRARLLAQANAFNGTDYSLTVQQGICTLVVSDASNQITIDTWEVGVNKMSLSVAYHPWLLPIIDNSGDASAVVRGIKQALEGTERYADIDDLDPVDPDDEAALFGFLNAARLGEDTYYQSRYVLRHTTNVSNRWNVNIADSHIDTIYTTAQLLSEVQSASLWIYPMPGRLAYKLLQVNIDFQFRYVTADNHLWGWLKYGSAESTAANNRVNIVTEYEFGLISTLLYPTL